MLVIFEILPTPKMNKHILSQLRDIVGPENISTSQAELTCVSYDGTAQQYLPEVAIWPGTAEQISRIMVIAHREGIPVVARGAGSGMTGGALPLMGGIVLALAKLDRIIAIDHANQTATVEPGVITGTLQSEVKRFGLFYPPDPASHKFCTLGGNVAEGAGGPSAVKYGVTRDYVKGLEVVLADGKIIHTGVHTDKGVVGYDLTRLFVGSEGTLGIITKIIVRLIPQPKAKQAFLVVMESMAEAATLVSEILCRFTPCILEFMDRTAIRIVAEQLPVALAAGTEAILLLELDGTAIAVKTESAELHDFLVGQPGVTLVRQAADSAEAEALWSARRAISPAAFSLRPHKMSEDVVVPRSKIPALVACAEGLAQELQLVIFCFGHAGDGNIHVNIMLDRSDPQQLRHAETAKQQLFKRVIELGGTLSGEHGVGITKSDYLPMELDTPTIATMRTIKQALDPTGILNPGKIFPQKS